MKFIETSSRNGDNVNEAFHMIAQEVSVRIFLDKFSFPFQIQNRVDEGELRPVDGWEGLKTGIMRSQSVCLSEQSFPQDGSGGACSC